MNPDSDLPVTPTAEDTAVAEETTTEEPQARTIEDRNIRHRDIINQDILNKTKVIIVGVGAIGRQLALQLSAIGAPNIWIMDPDTVAIENLAAQGFLEDDLEKSKVEAVADLCGRINPAVAFQKTEGKFRKDFINGLDREGDEDETRFVVFSCVDDMAARKKIWETFAAKFFQDGEEDPAALFLDARMGAEVSRTLVVSSRNGKDYYPRTLFEARDSLQQSCTAKTTIYCANIAAAMMVGQFTKWLRGMMTERDILLNIFTSELIHDSEDSV